MGIVESRRAIGEREGLDSASDAMRSEAKAAETGRTGREEAGGQGREGGAAQAGRRRSSTQGDCVNVNVQSSKDGSDGWLAQVE